MTLLKLLILIAMMMPAMLNAQTLFAGKKNLLFKSHFTVQALVDNSNNKDRLAQQQATENPLNKKGEITMEPWNLALRFGLELSALTAMGFWGYEKGDGGMRYALMIGVPLVAATAWGIFAVENDPSRSGNTVSATNGFARLALELGFFAFSTWTLYDMGFNNLAYTMSGLIVIHYAFSYKRILWLIAQ